MAANNKALLKIERVKRRYAERKMSEFEAMLAEEKRVCNVLRNTLQVVSDSNKELTATNAKLTVELMVLRGVVKAPVEESKPRREDDPLYKPDIVVVNETEQGERYAADMTQINDARKALEEGLAELAGEIDITNISPEAAEEAIVTSPEDWRRQHGGT